MKLKLSVSLDEDTVRKVEERLIRERGIFRNKSHFIELATQKMLEGR